MSVLQTSAAGMRTEILLQSGQPRSLLTLELIDRRTGGLSEERKMHFRFAACAGFIAVLFASVAHANTGIQLPLNQYQSGTETTTLVPNGNFESVVAGPD